MSWYKRLVKCNLLVGTCTTGWRILFCMKLIPLSGRLGQGRFAKVDDEWFDYLNQWTWRLNDAGYVIRSGERSGIKRRFYRMHRVIAGAVATQEVDHANGDTLDNQQVNLRLCTHQQNLCNQRRQHKGVFRGVQPFRSSSLWVAMIRSKGRVYCLGYFREARHAAMAYDIAARDLHGEFATLNFPDALHR